MARVSTRTATFPLALLVISTGVPAQNVDEMARWTALTVVHYRVVGEYSRDTQLIGPVTVRTTDRVEIEFDWDQFEMKLVGPAKITNAETQSSEPSGVGDCATPRVEGAFELLTVESISEPIPGFLNLVTKRDDPGGSYQGPSENGPCGNTTEVAAKSTPGTMMLQVVPAMMLGMGPPGTDPISPDGKSLIVRSDDWSWTFTPTPVR